MNTNKEYRKRVSDQLLKDQLEAAGGVLIQGAKWCGKTTTALQQARSVIYMNDPMKSANYKHLAETNISLLLEGDTPLLIDEWQLTPQLWDAARYTIDQRGMTGQFIFTGSAVPADRSRITHTGTGRFAWVTMRPMSLWESSESNGGISLASLFNGETQDCRAPGYDLKHIAFLTCRGGWPAALDLSEKASLRQAYNYIDAVSEQEISDVDGTRRDAALTKRLLRSYARHQGTQASVASILNDILTNENGSTTETTITSYLKALEKIFVIENMPAWNPNLRSKAAIRTSDTRYFVDPSVAAAALRLGPSDLIADLNTFGLLFETLAARDLRVYADALDGDVFHYRDKNGLECDAVLHLRNGHYGLIEVKIGGEKWIEQGAENLISLSNIINTEKMYEPSFMMVLTAVGDFAYRRKDGIYVVPITCLKP
ncbi:MAG: ATP-binding protein [bacterium]|nr:ATP-binding protein [Candidatus Limimorpha equi]